MVKVIDYQKKENAKTKEIYSILILEGRPEVAI
jgi:hypothetical protein